VYLNIYNACPHDSDDPTPSLVCSIVGPSLVAYQYAGNIGFGSANNQNFLAFPLHKENFLFVVVNPDISFEPASLIPLLDWVSASPDVSCVAPLIFNPGGLIQFSAKHDPTFTSLLLGKFPRLKRLPLFERYDRWHRNLDRDYRHECIESTYLSGCFLVIPSVWYFRIGGFSERYFLHLEDADIVRRLSRYGRCMHNPIGSVVHQWARGSHRSAVQIVHLMYSFLVYVFAWGFRVF
jgi:GT2 family glycosyltransferase